MATKSSHSHSGSRTSAKGERKIHKVMKEHKSGNAQVWQRQEGQEP